MTKTEYIVQFHWVDPEPNRQWTDFQNFDGNQIQAKRKVIEWNNDGDAGMKFRVIMRITTVQEFVIS